jgi:hypothetical protein
MTNEEKYQGTPFPNSKVYIDGDIHYDKSGDAAESHWPF